MSHWPILVTVHTYLSYFQMYVSSGLVKNFLFNYVPLAWISLGILLYIYIYILVSSGTCWNEKFQLCPTDLNFFRITYLDSNIFYVSSGTWTHTVLHYYFLRIACLPISTCLHYYIQKIHYPKNPIRVTPIFLPFYYFPFNPFHHSKIHYQSISFITPTKPTLLLTTQKKNPTLIFIFILHYTY